MMIAAIPHREEKDNNDDYIHYETLWKRKYGDLKKGKIASKHATLHSGEKQL